MTRHFVGEAIEADTATADTARMATGEPGLPTRFFRRGKPFTIVRVVRSWRETGPCHSGLARRPVGLRSTAEGSGEQYVRKHWYEVVTDSGATFTIYFQRHPRSRTKHGRKWRLYTEE